jgi:hypothetical protein
MKTHSKLLLLFLGALLLRLALLPFVEHPGIADPNHYYNLGRELVRGHGFQIDYIWHYYNPPDDVVHPDDFWMPLAGIVAAGGMALFGEHVQAAILPFLLIGALVPLLVYCAARQLDYPESTALFSAALASVLPEYVMNSLRTDALMPNVLLVSACLILLARGLRRNDTLALVGSGIAAGAAYLTRNDNVFLLPMFAVTFAVYWVFAPTKPRLWYGLLFPLVMLLVAAPWLLRNLDVMGSPTTPHLSRTFFFTDYRDLYTYGRELSWDTLRASQSWGAIIGKRLFEMAASLKIMYTTLDIALPVAVIGGLLVLSARRDRERLLALVPAAILLAGLYAYYTIISPFGSQGGSFKKSYLSLVPILIPVGAYAFQVAITNPRLRTGAMIITLGLMTANAIELTRADMRMASTYQHQMQEAVEVIDTLPDTNNDGRTIVMAQDQFMLSFLGVSSVVIPMDDRDTILAVARRYRVDYLLMPPARPALDPLYERTEADPRFVPLRSVPGNLFEIYGFDHGAAAPDK